MKGLIVVDMQQDFCHPNGSLFVKGARETISFINGLLESKLYDIVIATQDWHPVGHISFGDTHQKIAFSEPIETSYGKQEMWPIHCLEDSWGADFADGLLTSRFDMIVRKGTNPMVDSYSAFIEADGHELPSMKYVFDDDDSVDIVGVATDYCVRATAMDLYKRHTHDVTILVPGCAGVAPETSKKALDSMYETGIKIVYS